MIRINLTFDGSVPYWMSFAKEIPICLGGLAEHWELGVYDEKRRPIFREPLKLTLELLSKPTADTHPMMFNGEFVKVDALYGETLHYIIDTARRQLTKLGVKKKVTYHVRCMV